MADGPLMSGPRPVLDYQGQPDERTWVALEGVYESEVKRLGEEITFLREMLRLALASNTESNP